jgi:hypothetical protein
VTVRPVTVRYGTGGRLAAPAFAVYSRFEVADPDAVTTSLTVGDLSIMRKPWK